MWNVINCNFKRLPNVLNVLENDYTTHTCIKILQVKHIFLDLANITGHNNKKKDSSAWWL